MGWFKEEPFWSADGTPSNDAAREYGKPPWLGKSRERFKREDREREEYEQRAEEKRLELEYRMRPKPKKPGGRATADTILENKDGTLRNFVCECACGGGLVIEKTGDEISCHFCGATWMAEVDRESRNVALCSEVATIHLAASMFQAVRARG